MGPSAILIVKCRTEVRMEEAIVVRPEIAAIRKSCQRSLLLSLLVTLPIALG
jgi:hypothetical protein